MVVISLIKNKIFITGHAEYAPRGQDIVCAAVSTLTQVFVASIEELTEDNIRTDIRAGNAVIEYKNLSDRAQVLMDSFLLGLEMIAQNYPHHVRIVKA
jgi:uncharacterized protein YsxB (DUF464 family)